MTPRAEVTGSVPNDHTPTVIREGGNRFTVFCSCGWRSGERHDSEMSARMAWAMDHMTPADSELPGMWERSDFTGENDD